MPVVINLDVHRERAAHPAARPGVEPPIRPSTNAPSAAASPQRLCGLTSCPGRGRNCPGRRPPGPWPTRCSRAHIEGGNGRLKSVDTALHARERRQPRGRVARTLLLAITVMVHNIKKLKPYWSPARRAPLPALPPSRAKSPCPTQRPGRQPHPSPEVSAAAREPAHIP